MIPNLYSNPLEDSLLQQAQSDPFGTVTLWTYFSNCLDEASRRVSRLPTTDDEIRETSEIDIVFASFLIQQLPQLPGKKKPYLIRLLNRCVISTFDIVEGAASFMLEETGICPLETKSILQVLVAVAIKHHNHDVLQALARHRAPDRTVFSISYPVMISRLQASCISQKVWDALSTGAWVKASDSLPVDEGTLKYSRSTGVSKDQEQFQTPGNILDSCVQHRPSAELAAYFPFIPRSLYSGISPHPKWPGSLALVKYAAARTGSEGVEVLKLLVEIGGMDVNDSKTWWKAGDYDPREWEPKCFDGSDCQETPLHIAIDKSNLSTIEYLLTHGARSIVDAYGRNPKDRAAFRGRPEVMELFKRYG